MNTFIVFDPNTPMTSMIPSSPSILVNNNELISNNQIDQHHSYNIDLSNLVQFEVQHQQQQPNFISYYEQQISSVVAPPTMTLHNLEVGQSQQHQHLIQASSTYVSSSSIPHHHANEEHLNTEFHIIDNYVANYHPLDDIDTANLYSTTTTNEFNNNENNSMKMPVNSLSIDRPIELLETVVQQQQPTVISRVDLLNTIIQKTQNNNNVTPFPISSSSSSSSSTVSIYQPFSSNQQQQQQSHDYVIQPQLYVESTYSQQTTKRAAKKRKGAIMPKEEQEDNYTEDDRERMCVVCGTAGKKFNIGFHYGASTCEACKLFFRRMCNNSEQRKSSFAQCKTKNCHISPNSRANCPECRYKKCIAVGMSVHRSRYGRHPQDTNMNYTANIATDLCKILRGYIGMFYEKRRQYERQLGLLDQIIIGFYDQALSMISPSSSTSPLFDSHSMSTPSSSTHSSPISSSYSFSSSSSSSSSEHEFINTIAAANFNNGITPLSQLSSIVFSSTQSPLNNQDESHGRKLPDFFLAMWIVLFKLDMQPSNELIELRTEITNYFNILENHSLKKFELPETVKILLFLKTLWLYFARKVSTKKIDRITHPFTKRITDLIRAEFTTFECSGGQDEAAKRDLQDNATIVINEPGCLFLLFHRNFE